jgi:hypothetical protein
LVSPRTKPETQHRTGRPKGVVAETLDQHRLSRGRAAHYLSDNCRRRTQSTQSLADLSLKWLKDKDIQHKNKEIPDHRGFLAANGVA